MLKGILTYRWSCGSFDGKTYKEKKWVLDNTKITDKFTGLQVDADCGWYIDLDKNLCYYYTPYFESEGEIHEHIKSITPPKYELDCYVKYTYSIIEFDSGHCDSEEYIPIRENMTCICKENTTEDCVDEKENIKIKKLNACIPNPNGSSTYLKIDSEPTAIN